MNKFRRAVMWVGLALIILLLLVSVYGAFIGAERAQSFINRLPLVVYWSAFLLLLIVALVVFRRLVRVPGLLLIHLGCVFILAGAMWSSEAGHKLQKRLFGNNKIRSGQMIIHEGRSQKNVLLENEDQTFLFSVEVEYENDLDNRTISEELRKKFEENQTPLSQHVAVSFRPEDNAWVITDNLNEYFARKEKGTLNIYDPTEELPFFVKLKDFRIEYYEPAYLEVETGEGQSRRVVAEVGKEIDLGDELGTAKIVRTFENFKMSFEDGKTVAFDDPHPGSNPALEVQITQPDGQVIQQYVFSLFPGHSHSQSKLQLKYNRPVNRAISDFISELQIVEDGKVVAEKDIEVNHPLHYAGYHFYQHSYDSRGGRYTVLQVVSDTGIPVVFAGYWMLCIGVIWHLWLRHIVARRKVKNA